MTHPTISKIGQIAINVKDVSRAVDFYRDVLGLTVLFQMPNMAFIQCGEVRLMLAIPTSAEYDHAGSVIYYKVEDITAAHAHLETHTVTIDAGPTLIARMPDHELWMCFFRDPDNNQLAYMCERPLANA